MAAKRIHGRWVVFMQALGLASAWAIALGLVAGTIGVFAFAITRGAGIGG